ncbi:anion exchange protein 4 protein [Phlyctema vagabunda]|uniref:Anion exchange protein 4 protein n=1 Tax=Phlyctema vagabunda TaxID=108571 RepID=A0ABR4PRA7_9HELO
MATQTSTNSYTLPTTTLPHNSGEPHSPSLHKSWKSRLSFLKSAASSGEAPLSTNLHQSNTNASRKSNHTPKWWKIRLFRGMVNDLKRRAPFYTSDWTDAWDYRVVPATVYMYFANILPALAFSLDMFAKTDMSYGVNEVLLASVLGSVVFAVFAAQPLVIVGVTGPITVFNYTVYDIMVPTGTNYFAFMCWIGMQGAGDAFYLSIVVSLLVLVVGYICGIIGGSPLFQHYIRIFIKDYGTPLTVIFFTGFVHIGKMSDVSLSVLPTSKAFFPTIDRGWFIHFWDIKVADVFIAIPFAILLTVLFWFDHNVSSLIAQGTEFPLRKPAGFHWDIFLLGLTTGVAGLLGIPFPNGLIPQAPFHTDSLCVTRVVADPDEEGSNKGHVVTKVDHVVEQRVSNLAQGLLTLGTMSGPLLIVLHLIPQGVLAGLFFVMGVQALEGNGITLKILFLAKDKSLTPSSDPLRRIRRRKAIWIFVAIQLIGFGGTFAITQTIAAVGFPIIILLLIPFRTYILPRWFSQEELSLLDAPTASPFTMISVGGNFGESLDDLDSSSGGATTNETNTAGPSTSTSQGILVNKGADTDEGLAERGEVPGSGMKSRESWRAEGRSGRPAESIELRQPGMSHRSVSRQPI